MTTPQNFEAKVRRLARSEGLLLRKSRSRSPDDPTFGCYHLVDGHLNAIVFGSHPFDFTATLEDCVEFLSAD